MLSSSTRNASPVARFREFYARPRKQSGGVIIEHIVKDTKCILTLTMKVSTD